MKELRNHFITSKKQYREGDVFIFRKRFSLCKEVKRAVLYSTALGVYEIEINGEKAGKQMFAPGYSYYPRRLLYQENDITNLVKRGENRLKLYLGQGWYCGRFLCENRTQIYGKKPGASWILDIEYENGEKESFHSDTRMEEVKSSYEYAGEYDGEIYHADVPEMVIGMAVAYEEFIPELDKTSMEVRIKEEMPIQNISTVNGNVILDFGQNFAGIIEIDPLCLFGEKITVKHGEILNKDGSLYTKNLRKAKAEIVYYSGREKKKYRPRFTYMGFRYVEISGVAYIPGLITAYALYSHMERTGWFSCMNSMVQKLYDNQIWGQKSNYVEIPTDCPQRDERMGYTGDSHVFALTGAYNFDTHEFWKNFLTDLRLGQLDNREGYIGATVPADKDDGIGFINMLGWGNAVTILPKLLEMQFGDMEAFSIQYESMKKFVEAEIRQMKGKDLWLAPNLGDWLAPGKDITWQAMHNHPVSNAFIVHDLEIMMNVADRMGKTEDAKRYEEQFTKTREAYLKAFVSDDGEVADDYQSAYVMALKYVIPEGALREQVLKKYARNVRKYGLDTGFFATEHLLPLLVEAGESKLAYDILLQEECPGWMYQIRHGATTTWERWDAIKSDGSINEEAVGVSGENMVSFNHYAFGSVGEFYYQYILGIKPAAPGFQSVIIQPVTDKRLMEVEGKYKSRAGLISSAWKYEDDEIHFRITTPSETKIVLPDGRIEYVGAGSYHYKMKG